VVKDNYKKYKQLRSDYDFFIYEKYSITDNNEKLSVTYEFNLADKYFFYPTIDFIKGKHFPKKLTQPQIENFVFQIGLIELISYWKVACPPKILIKPFKLNDDQVIWWKTLWFNGLGEFFYLNNLNPGIDEFVIVNCFSEKVTEPFGLDLEIDKVLIPVGGGKDSVITLELLKPHYNCIPFIINPRGASMKTILAAGFGEEDFIEVRRTIHPQLLRLNTQGFLNGHTPFSALLAFVSVFSAAMNGARSIALSNESSANEPTERNSGANHQYSKSFTFEKDFRNYIKKYISGDINYFSFLRPINEYSIAGLFSHYPDYFGVFKSCNSGSKTNSWCGNCPKCLFTFIILSPHLPQKTLINIFGKDLLNDEKLIGYFKELMGLSKIKPFECVGTIDEVNFALVEIVKNRKDKLPSLLKYYSSTSYYKRYKDFPKEELTRIEENDHFLEDRFMKILKKALNA
jgi:UDP-N-acetyl-alpha-D-muramoyl-L-alanyl-L-glutamate epimerase